MNSHATLYQTRVLESELLQEYVIKVTVHVGTDQNVEIEIFTEYKHTLNELPVKKKFNMSNSLREIANESFYRK